MEFTFDPSHLFSPGEGEDFFRSRPPFEAGASAFSYANAYWLAELSRLVYRQEASEGVARGPSEPTRAELLERVGLRERFFFYEEAQAQGFLVEPRDERWSALVFRGTDAPHKWLTNTNALLASWAPGGQVHMGFRDALLEVWPRIEPELDPARPLFVAGHSLGGALATLAGGLLSGTSPLRAVYTYGAPRVGNGAFAESIAEVALHRVVNNKDAVTQVPLPLPPLGFVHTGRLHYFDGAGQPRVEPSDASVVFDRLRYEGFDNGRSFTDLPKFLTDHAPWNYTALISRQLHGVDDC